MKNIPIVGKFLVIMAGFGLFAVGTTVYSGRQTSSIDAAYSALLEEQQKASLYLARSNRSLQATRSSIGDLLMARSKEANEAAEKELAANRASFISYIDTAMSALPGRSEIGKLKADGLTIIEATCAGTVKTARAS